MLTTNVVLETDFGADYSPEVGLTGQSLPVLMRCGVCVLR